MSNPNVLVSLAYIKSNDNPLHVFCSYILYILLTSSNKALRIDEFKENLCERFGLKMPLQMISTCTRVLLKSKEIQLLPHGAGYSVGVTDFDIASIESDLRRLQEQENKVIFSLIAFVEERYKHNWTEENAKQYLSHFLEVEGNAARLFLRQDIQTDAKRVSPSWYIGRYISSVIKKSNSVEKTYLEDIVKGMMIYVGINQTNDYQQDRCQKFRGTTFFFDTKLILRLLGYSWTAQVESARELYELITKEYGGIICIFPQTLTEITKAMDSAGKSFQKSKQIKDEEFRLYAELNPVGASLLSDAALVVATRLQNEFNIHLSQPINWNENKRYTIEIEEIENYIASKHPSWRKGTIQYDVEIINQINILRQSDYSVRYGGAKKLPVFITSNGDLVYSFRDYVEKAVSDDPNACWNVHALPIISDTMILFRLWLPHAEQYSGLPSITLARFAYAAQNPDSQYFEKLRETAASYEAQEGVSLLNLNEARRQKLEDILVVHSRGDAEELNADVMATSVEELVALENIDLHAKVSKYENRFEKQDALISEKDKQIVNLIAKPLISKIGLIGRVKIILAKFWWAFAVVLLLLVRFILSNCLSGFKTSTSVVSWIIPFVPLIIEIVFTIIDKVVDRSFLQDFFLKKAISSVWMNYAAKVSNSIPKEHSALEKQVIEKCKMETPVFKKYREYCVSE